MQPDNIHVDTDEYQDIQDSGLVGKKKTGDQQNQSSTETKRRETFAVQDVVIISIKYRTNKRELRCWTK